MSKSLVTLIFHVVIVMFERGMISLMMRHLRHAEPVCNVLESRLKGYL